MNAWESEDLPINVVPSTKSSFVSIVANSVIGSHLIIFPVDFPSEEITSSPDKKLFFAKVISNTGNCFSGIALPEDSTESNVPGVSPGSKNPSRL